MYHNGSLTEQKNRKRRGRDGGTFAREEVGTSPLARYERWVEDGASFRTPALREGKGGGGGGEKPMLSTFLPKKKHIRIRKRLERY